MSDPDTLFWEAFESGEPLAKFVMNLHLDLHLGFRPSTDWTEL